MNILSLCFGSSLLFSSPTPPPVEKDTYFSNGITDPQSLYQIQHFDRFYSSYAPLLLKRLGNEVVTYYQKQPNDRDMQMLTRYFQAIVARIAYIKKEDTEQSETILWVKELVPATKAELSFITGDPVPALQMGKTLKDILQDHLHKKLKKVYRAS